MDAQTRSNLRYGIADGVLATPWTILSLPAGFIISALLNLHYGIRPGMFGLIVSLPAWANASQILLLPFLARFFTARDMTLAMSWLNVGLWGMLAAVLPFLPDDNRVAAGQIFLIFYILASASASFLGLGWLAWIRQWVPPEIRGVYFGRRNRYIALVTLAFLIVSMVLLGRYPDSVATYQAILIIGAGMRFGSVLMQHRIIDDHSTHEPLVQGQWWSQLRVALRHPGFIAFIGFNAWVNFWINMTGPFGTVFVYEQLHLSPGQFAVFNILSTLTGALTMPLWGKFIDRRGCVPAIGLGLLMWQTQNYLWAVLTPETSWILYPMWLWGGGTAAAFLLGSFNLLLKIIPQEAKTAGISLNLAATSVAAGAAPIIAGVILDLGQDRGWSELLIYRIGFVLCPTAILLSLLLLKRIREPDSDPRYSTVWGATRMLRQSLQSFGLAALANTTLVGRKPRQPGPGPDNSSPASPEKGEE
ncbi:MFS transporter [Ruficoccus amylovorans]|uniref:MFS transporter n=1 Tax=Ruficoccus amylovorans TaxID=1804625 RepID=A0A842HK06_9BACT|nr:MFS transporter [Ruficoccus amylovorans]MBC2595817.1 MFS transporter [Ruficoccus amylovorans]